MEIENQDAISPPPNENTPEINSRSRENYIENQSMN